MCVSYTRRVRHHSAVQTFFIPFFLLLLQLPSPRGSTPFVSAHKLVFILALRAAPQDLLVEGISLLVVHCAITFARPRPLLKDHPNPYIRRFKRSPSEQRGIPATLRLHFLIDFALRFRLSGPLNLLRLQPSRRKKPRLRLCRPDLTSTALHHPALYRRPCVWDCPTLAKQGSTLPKPAIITRAYYPAKRAFRPAGRPPHT